MPDDAVQIMATVLEVQHRARLPCLAQRTQAEVGEGHHFHIRRGVGSDTIAREREVAGREYAALCVMDIDVLDVGQIAATAGHDDVDLVFDRTCLRAEAHPAVALPFVGQEGHEQDIDTLVYQVARQLRELRVIADQYTDRTAVGIDQVEFVATLDVPPVALVGRRVNFFLHRQCAVAAKNVADIADAVAAQCGRRAADDVDVVAHCELAEHRNDRLLVAGDGRDGFVRLLFLVFQ